MIKISCFGDYKVNDTENLGVSGELKFLMEQSDINLLNFEAPVESSGRPISKSGPILSQSKNAIQWIRTLGFNVVSLANNHIYDYGEEGVNKTISELQEVTVVGGGQNAYSLKTLAIKDKKIGFLAAAHCEFGTLTDNNSGKGAAWISHPVFIRNIIESREKVDYLILIAHAGIEYFDYPLPEWRELYKLFIDLGADAVIGSHPHVPQGWEFHKGKPICYSLGNFCFQSNDKKTPLHWNHGLVATLELNSKQDIRLIINNIEYNPKTRHITLNHSQNFINHINEINQVLLDDRRYITEINKKAIGSLSLYYRLFAESGLVSIKGIKGFIRGCIKCILGRSWLPYTHALNNIQCESHRWLIIRGMKLLKK